MNKYKIESGVPIPAGYGPRGTSQYPFMDMKVGDSFQVKDRTINAVRQNAFSWSRGSGKKFSVRKDGKFVRAWRTK